MWFSALSVFNKLLFYIFKNFITKDIISNFESHTPWKFHTAFWVTQVPHLKIYNKQKIPENQEWNNSQKESVSGKNITAIRLKMGTESPSIGKLAMEAGNKDLKTDLFIHSLFPSFQNKFQINSIPKLILPRKKSNLLPNITSTTRTVWCSF